MTTAITPESVCASIVERLINAVGKRRYEIWFQRSARLDYHDAPPRLDIKVRNQFIADWIGRHFLQTVRDAAHRETDGPVALSIEVDPDRFPETTREARASLVATESHSTKFSAGGHSAILRNGYIGHVWRPHNFCFSREGFG